MSSGFDTRFIGYSPGGITINYNTFNLTVTNCVTANNDNTSKVSVTTLHKLQTSLLTSGFFWFNCSAPRTSFLLSLYLLCVCICLALSGLKSTSNPLKTVLRRLSRDHLIEGFCLSVVTKTTPPLCRKRLSILFALQLQWKRLCPLPRR
jgi:hypothetical protein